jgi:Cof subfamily protein (haloacid dehalogenase superfamily)
MLKDDCRISGIEAIVATDFDGTLLQSDHTVSELSKKTLIKLGESNILRVIVTGRSLYTLNKVLTEDVPMDYLIVASGAGIYCRESRQLIYNTELSMEDTELIGNQLLDLGCDFMVHHPLPDNHKFLFHHKNNSNLDYKQRFDIYEEHAKPLNNFSELSDGSSQFLIIDLPDGNLHENISNLLAEYTVIKTTSPLDHQSVWIEIFPLKTDKGKSLKILTENYNLGADKVLSIGNDFNDVHMLRWADQSRVVSNAHEDLRAEFRTVSSNDNEGFSEAVEEWLRNRT